MNFSDHRQEHINDLKRRNGQANNIIGKYRGFLQAIQGLASESLVTEPYELRRDILRLAREAETRERDLMRLGR